MDASPDFSAETVLEFWFGATDVPRTVWFRKRAAFDAQMADRFGSLVAAALRENQGPRFASWRQTAADSVALVLLLDQFPRNIFRNTARAFAGDAAALALTREVVDRGDDIPLNALRRWFLYMPFMHAEDLAAQNTCVRLLEQLVEAAPEHETTLVNALHYAQRHREVIRQFGRFPHRNEIVGRESTPAELAFLKLRGSRF